MKTTRRPSVIIHYLEAGPSSRPLCSPSPPPPFLQAAWGGGCRVLDRAEPTPHVSVLPSWLRPPRDLQLDRSTPEGVPGSQGWGRGGWGRATERGEQKPGARSHSSPDPVKARTAFKSFFIYLLCFLEPSDACEYYCCCGTYYYFVILHSLRCTEASLSTGRQTSDLSEQKYVNLSEKQSKSTISQETEKILT